MPENNLVLRSLPQQTLERLKPRLRQVSLSSKQILCSVGERIQNIYFPVAGAVSLVVELETGARIESALLGRHDVIGGDAMLDDREAIYTAVVQVPGTAYSLPADFARQTLEESPEFRTAIARHDQLILAQAQQSAACNAVHNLDQRLARWLLHVRDVTGSDTFLLTQELIAEMLGVGRTSVSLIAQGFQEAGVVTYRRGHITLDRLPSLRATACECYHSIRTRYHRVEEREEAVPHGPPQRA